MQKFRTLFLVAVTLAYLAACAPNDSMNKIVQNGGTILLSLGAHEELGQVNLSSDNLTAKLTDSAGGQVDVTVREVFPLNVDRTSAMNVAQTTQFDGYSGFWFAAIDLVDPVTGLPTSLASGDATLRVFGLSTVLTRTLRILPGAGAINPVMSLGGAGTLELLQPAAQVKYALADPQSVFNESNLLGAIEFRFEYPAASVAGLPQAQWPRGVSATNNQHLQIQSFTRTDGDTNTLHVIALNPAGIGRVSAPNVEVAPFHQVSRVQAVRFSVVYPPEFSAAQFASASAVTAYGLDGSQVSADALLVGTPTI